MLRLVVSAPGGRKADIECDPSATFGDVKARIEQTLGVPADKQKLLCNGKERKAAAETLASAGVTGKSKLMLMLAPGYQMPSAPAAPSADADVAMPSWAMTCGDAIMSSTAAAVEEEATEAEALNLEGEMPLPEGVSASAGGTCVVHVRSGRSRYHVKVPQGLGGATFGELADYMVAELLFPPGLPSAELRFIAKGKTMERTQRLAGESVREATVMLLFREGFHLAEEGANWLRGYAQELADAEALLEKLGKRIEANFFTDETPIQLAQVGGLLGTLKHSVGIVRVRQGSLPELSIFRDRVVKADERMEELRDKMKAHW